MRKAEAAGNDDCPVKIKLVAPPAYVLNTQTLDKVSICLLHIFMGSLFYLSEMFLVFTFQKYQIGLWWSIFIVLRSFWSRTCSTC